MGQVRRRRFLLASGALLASPYAVAQPRERSPVVGILGQYNRPTPEEWSKSPYATRLRELGWVEGKNIHVDIAYAEGNPDRLAGLAAELVRKRVDVIVARGAAEAVAAARTTKTIPIIFVAVAYPIELGLVPSLARPGGNVTGVAYYSGGQAQNVKPMEFLRQIVPKARRMPRIASATIPLTVAGNKMVYPQIQAAIAALGFEGQLHYADRDEDYEAVFASIAASGAQAIMVNSSPSSRRNARRIVEFANQQRLPSAFNDGTFVDLGGLVSYAPVLSELQRRGVDYVDRVLRGARPEDLPVEMPTKFELAVNLKTAKALNVTVPRSVLVQADRVIE